MKYEYAWPHHPGNQQFHFSVVDPIINISMRAQNIYDTETVLRKTIKKKWIIWKISSSLEKYYHSQKNKNKFSQSYKCPDHEIHKRKILNQLKSIKKNWLTIEIFLPNSFHFLHLRLIQYNFLVREDVSKLSFSVWYLLGITTFVSDLIPKQYL